MTIKYTEDFNKIWKCFGITERHGLGARGVKAEAFAAWEKIIDRPDVEVMIAALRKQANEKIAYRRKTGRDPQSFKWACRWFKWRAWEGDDDLEMLPSAQALAEVETKDRLESKMAKIKDRSWAV